MEHGGTRRNMVTSGFRPRWMLVGRHIPTDNGFTKVRGDGPGTTTHPGDSLHFTMADGLASAGIGDGRRDHIMADGDADFTHPRWFHGLAARAGALDLASVSAADTDGARSVLENLSDPGTTPDGATSAE